MRLLHPAPPRALLDVPLEQLLQRMPPLGWHGIDCANGQVIAEGARVMVVVERMRAFPQGVEICLGFHTGEDELARRAAAEASYSEFMERLRKERPELPPTGDFRVSNRVELVSHRLPHPERDPDLHPIVTVRVGRAQVPLHHANALVTIADDECVAFESTRRASTLPGALMRVWVRPLDKLRGKLTFDVSWPEEGLAGATEIDLAEAKIAAGRARRLYEVEFREAGPE